MNQKHPNNFHQNVHFLSKTSSTRSCENLFCLTKRCNQDQSKEKERILHNQYFEKLSLKKFNNSTVINHSIYQKDKVIQRNLRRDKSTQENEFKNIILYPHNQQLIKFRNGNEKQLKCHTNYEFEEARRIARSSSHRNLQKPMLQTTDRSIEKQIHQEFRRIQELQRLRNRLETEIRQLDQNIDKYYHIYHSKLEQLRMIQTKMSELSGGVQRSMKKIPSKEVLQSFKKKSYWEQVDGNRLVPNSNQGQTIDIHTARMYNYQNSPINFGSYNGLGFVKKSI